MSVTVARIVHGWLTLFWYLSFHFQPSGVSTVTAISKQSTGGFRHPYIATAKLLFEFSGNMSPSMCLPTARESFEGPGEACRGHEDVSGSYIKRHIARLLVLDAASPGSAPELYRI
ncbi:hypothetical protein EJ04DRAFT_516144 [Polyplosphaeria fusca]|uniref:Secreted protein n=1 Tax=Polyplosphaeria fusca TaxID=682080 RepID=A0A9P4QKR8_9PLEO|nr:hypothetical protein EJ04DRAFT_516144 [Polyplosphaeria fusca]